jgi:hypothetical protein
MRRWEIVVGIVFLLAAEGCSSLVRKIRKACFL